jgi:hypothetical protein
MYGDIRGDRAELRLTRGYVHLCHAPADRNGAKTVSLARLIQDMRARQSSKIRELGDALIAEGYLTLNEQARALGLGLSTTWTILKRTYKTSGLSAGIINRMLAAPRLPALVRARILEYIDEKTAGLYGHSNTQLRRFAIRLTVKPANRTRPSGTKVDKEIVNWRSNSISTLHSSSQLQKRPADGLAILNSAHQEI